MNYAEIKRLASAGIAFFSDGDGEFKCITQAGGVASLTATLKY